MKDKVALVTGAAAGIGRATALELARRGARVVISDVNAEGLKETAALANEFEERQLLDIKADISQPDEVQSLIDQTTREFGRLDIAVNNAGIEGAQAATADYTVQDWDRVMNVNLRGQWLCMKYEIPVMLKQEQGAIINISSILGKVGFENTPAYTAAKHGLVGLTKAAALDYSARGIRINAVCPAFIETPMLERAGITSNAETRKEISALHPIGRLGEADEVAQAIVWLASDEASFVTGHAMMVDGGYTSR